MDLLLWIALHVGYHLLINTCFNTLSAADTVLRGQWGRVFEGDYCDHESFSANCASGEILQILDAQYGHIRIGKCIEADLGLFGCKAEVTDILQAACNGKRSCEISVDDNRFRDTQPCQKGVTLQVEARYACLSAVPDYNLCQGLKAEPSLKYIASWQLSNLRCSNDQHLRISGQPGQNISFSAIRLTDAETASVGFIVNEDSREHLPISIVHQNNQLGSLKAKSVSLSLDQLPPKAAFVIAYQVVGCPDINAPKDATVTRTDSDAKVSCIHTEQSWNLKCRGVHWLGIIGNCTRTAILPITARPKVNPPVVEDIIIEKDVIYVIVICITVFLSVLVITTGYVCLRTARIQSGLECRKKPTEPEWAFGANQTMTLLAKQRPDSDYLQPMYPGDAQNVMPAAIYDTPPPNPMQVPQDNTCTSVKQNNDEDYNATVSSTSTDYKKYFVLDKDYMNTKEFINNV
ncbi:hypothetical protein CAPTEDRAFT_228995 [Capitella teleta]|uniref:SUEL-type lectin domain-containing protein n=1 Tax=Capitella teleta TaxID=283909 RepID=R7UNW8_CAPTE|nr:hypothetical protein CAPTEDRAFT_228995 [Capitella teleta]|eukprot:ELU05617.1 hypothetical protein CAPTEDRAFT_228995 [Capitella teleta]